MEDFHWFSNYAVVSHFDIAFLVPFAVQLSLTCSVVWRTRRLGWAGSAGSARNSVRWRWNPKGYSVLGMVIEIVRHCMLHCGTLSRKPLGERRSLKLFLPENMEEAKCRLLASPKMSLHARKESIDREIHERQLSPMLRISWNLQRSTPETPKSRDRDLDRREQSLRHTLTSCPQCDLFADPPGQPVEIED